MATRFPSIFKTIDQPYEFCKCTRLIVKIIWKQVKLPGGGIITRKKRMLRTKVDRIPTRIFSARCWRSGTTESLSLLHQDKLPPLPFSIKSLTMTARSCSLSWLKPPI